ncbi:histidine phosphatase family protein [Burkholderiaceae bacterium DAT-1]|nr:histidine phosphatase family protein [Burkholderiaceae bacterium DAT-1]
MMNLILWRHADAEPGTIDLERPLTSKGHKQAARVAEWLKEHLPADTRLVSSQATRAIETLSALSLSFEQDARVNPCAAAEDYLETAGWPDAQGSVLITGHQPSIGHVLAELLGPNPAGWSVKKGSVWWLQHRVRDGVAQTVLKAMISAEML